MSGLTIKAKQVFFDKKLVERLLGKQAARNIGRALAFVRTRARSLLRRRKKSTPAGQPPSVHSQSTFANLRNIWFALDVDRLVGVCGPLRFQSRRIESASAETGAATQEFGGRIRVRARTSKRTGQPLKVRKPINIAPHPFMLPALQSEAPKFPSLWLRNG